MIKNLFMYLCSFLMISSSYSCVNITNDIEYNDNCYIYTIEKLNCCNYFNLNSECLNIYNNCVNYEHYIINNLVDQCDSYNSTIYNISYSNKCHNFTVHLDNSCCDNINQNECLNWYIGCNNFSENSRCLLPMQYSNNYCANYVSHINSECCNSFNDQCKRIYDWCLLNHPHENSIFNLYLRPLHGYTIGNNINVLNNIEIENCAKECINLYYCRSFDYFYDTNECYLSYHVNGDVISDENNNIVSHVTLLHDRNASYYEKSIILPYDHVHCNVEYPSWLGDGICDFIGGYNTEQCNYDNGDCCYESCNFLFCGMINDFYCLDPSINFPSTTTITSTPTTTRTSTPTTTRTSTPTTTRTSTPITTRTSTPTTTRTLTPTTTRTSTPTTTATSTQITTKTSTVTTKLSLTTIPIQTSISENTQETHESLITTTISSNIEKQNSNNNSENNNKHMSTALIIIISLSVIVFIFIICSIIYYIHSNKRMINQINNSRTTPSFTNPIYSIHQDQNGDLNENNYKELEIQDEVFIDENYLNIGSNSDESNI